MAFRRFSLWAMLFCAVLSLPAAAMGQAIAWGTNLEAAKMEARQTGRLVLVHFWTEECVPCAELERKVFNQPEVAAAMKQGFVPVKLNANDHVATATTMGVARVPMDIVLTPDGEVVGKAISPDSPMAYIARLSQFTNAYATRTGKAFDAAVAGAPNPSQINSVYAGLKIPPATQPALTELPKAITSTGSPISPFAMPPAMAQSTPPAIVQNSAPPLATNPPAAATAPPRQPVQPSTIDNRYVQTPPATPAAQSPPQVNPFDERYKAAAPAASASAMNSQAAVAAPNVAMTNPIAAPALSMAPPANTATANSYAPVAPTDSNPYATTSPAVAAATQPKQAPPASAYAANASPDARQLPAGAMPLGFEGFCPVSMRNSNLSKWVAGNPKYGVQHRGRTYWFAGPAEQQQFLANPDYFAPALSGLDPVMAVDHRQQVPGKREHSIDYDNVFYMFVSEASLQQFVANPEKYAGSVRQAMGIQPHRTLLRK